MAVITLDFHSKALKMCTLVTLVVPDSVRIKGIPHAYCKRTWF